MNLTCGKIETHLKSRLVPSHQMAIKLLPHDPGLLAWEWQMRIVRKFCCRKTVGMMDQGYMVSKGFHYVE